MTATITMPEETAKALMGYFNTTDLNEAVMVAVNGRLHLLGYEFPCLERASPWVLPARSPEEIAEIARHAAEGIEAFLKDAPP